MPNREKTEYEKELEEQITGLLAERKQEEKRRFDILEDQLQRCISVQSGQHEVVSTKLENIEDQLMIGKKVHDEILASQKETTVILRGPTEEPAKGMIPRVYSLEKETKSLFKLFFLLSVILTLFIVIGTGLGDSILSYFRGH